MVQSVASLYEVEDIFEEEKVLIVNDILRGESNSIKLIDIGMSESIKINALVYTRLLHLDEFSMTSGLGFIFNSKHRDYILNRSRKMQEKIKTGDNFNRQIRCFL